MTTTNTTTTSSEYRAGFADGREEAEADAWTPELFAAWLEGCGEARDDYDRGFRAGVSEVLSSKAS